MRNPRRSVCGLSTAILLALCVPPRAKAQPKPPIPLDVVLDTPQALMPQLPRVLWIPGGEAFAQIASDGDEEVVHRVPVDATAAPTELLTASAVWTALADGGRAGEPSRHLPPFSFVDRDTLRLETDDAVWWWRIGSAAATRRVLRIAEATTTVIAPDDRTVAAIVAHDLVITKHDGTRRRITWDGSPDIEYGGAAHRAEFGIRAGLFWSPDGRRLAFYREDLRPIAACPYADWTQVPPKPLPGRYPMAGRAHSKVQVGVYDRDDDSVRFLEHDPDQDVYWTNVTFAPGGARIFVALVGRGQDRMELTAFDSASGARLGVLFAESDAQWVEPEHGPLFLPDGQSFLWLSPRDGHRHLYHYDLDGTLLGQVTRGPFDVASFEGFAPDGRSAWITASDDDPREMHLWSVPLADDAASAQPGVREVEAPVALRTATLVRAGSAPAAVATSPRARLTEAPGWHTPIVEPVRGAVLDVWSSLEVPGRIELIAGTHRRTIASARDPFAQFAVGVQRLFEVPAADGTRLFAHALFPPGLDPDDAAIGRQHPVLLYVYGGPKSQLVRNQWNGGLGLWLHCLASRGYVVVHADNRGTDNRGIEFAQLLHRRLGTLEVEDQLRVVEHVKAWPFVEAARIGVHGWSYGGYMTLRLMLLAPGVFRCGIAGAPVTDWAQYETGYGERYMDTPQENADGYAASSCLPLAGRLADRLLVIHGSDDRTVVLSHAYAFVEACVQAGTFADLLVYPTQLHGFRGTHRKHVVRAMLRYLRDHLGV